MYCYFADPDFDDLETIFSNANSYWLFFYTELPVIGSSAGVLADIAPIEIPPFSLVTLPNGNRAVKQDIHILCPIDVRIAGEGLFNADVGGDLLAFGGLQLVRGIERTLPLRMDTHYIGHLPLQLQISFTGNDAIFDVHTHDYYRVLNQLYPSGDAWPQDPDSPWQQFILAKSIEYSRVAYRANLFRSEIFPLTAEETILEWEDLLGLPEFGESGLTLAQRQQQAHDKYTQIISPTNDYFIGLAEDLGYTGVYIRLEGDPFTCVSYCTDFLRGGVWNFTWTLVTDQSTSNDDLLMARVRKYTPEHTRVLFELGP